MMLKICLPHTYYWHMAWFDLKKNFKAQQKAEEKRLKRQRSDQDHIQILKYDTDVGFMSKNETTLINKCYNWKSEQHAGTDG